MCKQTLKLPKGDANCGGGGGGAVVVMNRFSPESRSSVAPPLLGLSSSQPLETRSFPRLRGRVRVYTTGLRKGKTFTTAPCLPREPAGIFMRCYSHIVLRAFSLFSSILPSLAHQLAKDCLELQAGERLRAAAQASVYTSRAFTRQCAVDPGVSELLRSWVAKIGGPGSQRRPLLSYWELRDLNGQARGALYGPKAEWGLDP